MMKKKGKYVYGMAMMSVCLVLCGCRVQDKAITLPVLEQTEAVQDGEVAGNDDAMSDKAGQVIYVHVCGAVQNPGVIGLPAGSRREDACETYVNLAALLTDGEQLYIPDEEEGKQLKQAQLGGGSTVVNINTATQEMLCTLPGIGNSRAKDIIAYREKNGKFLRKEDIMQVSGIKKSIYQKICEQIVVE